MKETSAALLDKARMALEAAQRDIAAKDADNAVSRSYYAAFHAATAALHEAGLAAKTHTGTHRLFHKTYAVGDRRNREMSQQLVSLYQDRQQADYAFGSTFDLHAARNALERATSFVEGVYDLLEEDDP